MREKGLLSRCSKISPRESRPFSLAVDRSFIPLGAIVAYGVNAPDQKLGKIPLRGIGFAQDVGGAIKRNRIDIFCGGNERANYVASHLDAKGPAWILLAKD